MIPSRSPSSLGYRQRPAQHALHFASGNVYGAPVQESKSFAADLIEQVGILGFAPWLFLLHQDLVRDSRPELPRTPQRS
jgi:hypothetical protein